MDLIETYNEILKREEDSTIKLLNKTLDKSFSRLIRRTRVWLRLGRKGEVARRNVSLLQEFRQLVPAVNPNRTDAYDRLFRNMLTDASNRGVDLSDAMMGQMSPGKPRVDVSIPLEAVTAAARQAKGYLRRHGDTFASTSAEIVAQGIAEGRPTDEMVSDMQSRLKVVKSRAEVIVRTESLRAYNDASNTYYSQQGVDYVVWYATSDDRTCPVCAPRAGEVFKRQEVRVPVHPRCRCYLAPYDKELAEMDDDYAKFPERHKAEVARETGITLSDDLTKAVFESNTPKAVSID